MFRIRFLIVLSVLLIGKGMMATVCTNEISVVPAMNALFKVIIFDLGDVIFGTSRLWHISEVHKQRVMQQHGEYPEVAVFLQKPSVQRDIWKFLHEVSVGLTPNDSTMLPLFPTFITNWLTGMSDEEGVAIIQSHLAVSRYSEGMKNMWLALTQHFLNPELLVASLDVIEPVVRLAKACKVGGYRLYVLSNWGHSSWNHLCEKHADILNLFDGMVYSGEEKIGKPNEQIYRILLERYNLDASQCLFIDDVDHNIKAAEKVGIRGIHMDSIESVYRQLQALGLLIEYSNRENAQ